MTGKGTGLGLSQVYGFASQSGGEVHIDSRPGEGTIVTLLLPCSGATGEARVEEGLAAPQRRRTGQILLVEDNDEVGAFAEDLLVELGHQVRRARSGEEAIEIAGGEAFDAVFSDVVMPGMSGLELAEQLAESGPTSPSSSPPAIATRSPNRAPAAGRSSSSPTGWKRSRRRSTRR